MSKIKLFEQKEVRTVWNESEKQWYFSVVDVVGILSESADPRKYWSVLKTRLKAEGSELTTICSQLKMQASDGKYYKSDVLNTDGILRLIQSIPSKKAEPFKLWLAKVGRERLEEIANPELAIERIRQTYLKKGYSDEWIQNRLRSIDIRKKLTDEWQSRGIDDTRDYAILTAEISKAAFGMTPCEYRQFKRIEDPLANVRDHMTDLELIFTMLSEASTKDIAIQTDAHGFGENMSVARAGGKVARIAKEEHERITGKSVSSKINYLSESEKNHRKRLDKNKNT